MTSENSREFFANCITLHRDHAWMVPALWEHTLRRCMKYVTRRGGGFVRRGRENGFTLRARAIRVED